MPIAGRDTHCGALEIEAADALSISSGQLPLYGPAAAGQKFVSLFHQFRVTGKSISRVQGAEQRLI